MIKLTVYLLVFIKFAYAQEFLEELATPVPTPSRIDQEQVLEEKEDDSLVMVPGDPSLFDDRFEIPPDEALGDCIYAAGMSFPRVCFDNGEVVFNVEVHSQEDLDRIISKQGKQGEYNKIPPGYREKLKERSDGFRIIDPGVPYTIKPSVEGSED